ncbi:MAG: NCS2 family permease, partial [Acidobacteriota bacterium]|nr:NCS2 family permease [Acidobacteriota bacterium]
EALTAIGCLLVMVALTLRKVPGAILVGVVLGSGVLWAGGQAPLPEALWSLQVFPHETFLALDLSAVWTRGLLGAILALFFVDLLDTAGTLIGVGMMGGFVDERGELPRADRAFMADAVATTGGALLGTSTVTTYIESATGIEEGGRTGLVAVVVATLFLLSLAFAPVFVAVPAAATAPALVLVGAMMMRGTRDIAWRQLDEAIPAFLTMIAMPLTFSIANGLALGIVSWVVIRLLSGRAREVGAARFVLAALLVVFVLFLERGWGANGS